MRIIRSQRTTVARDKGKLPPKEGNGVLQVFIAVSIHYLMHPLTLGKRMTEINKVTWDIGTCRVHGGQLL